VLLAQDGDAPSCGQSTNDDARPPSQCAALLRAEVVPILSEAAPPRAPAVAVVPPPAPAAPPAAKSSPQREVPALERISWFGKAGARGATDLAYAAMTSVDWRSCGGGASTFVMGMEWAESGEVVGCEVHRSYPPLSPRVIACIEQRFRAIKLPPFSKDGGVGVLSVQFP
jgi:hypothetical protein